jgi:hypothetical protein
MQLDEVELFALKLLFDDKNTGDPDQMVNADDYRVQERIVTRTGFFSIIKCLRPSERIQPLQEIYKRFSHPRLKRGGVFVCWVEPDLSLCLEGVAQRTNWPSELLPLALQIPENKFKPIGRSPGLRTPPVR